MRKPWMKKWKLHQPFPSQKTQQNKEQKSKQPGKYSKYTKIVIESIDKGANPNEKQLGKVYTTFKPKPQRRPSNKDKNKLIKPIANNNEDKKRSQST